LVVSLAQSATPGTDHRNSSGWCDETGGRPGPSCDETTATNSLCRGTLATAHVAAGDARTGMVTWVLKKENLDGMDKWIAFFMDLG